jgi:uncharacterized protein (DUF1330 family)
MPAYVIANIQVTDEAGYELYKEMVPASLERFGARYVARGGRAELLEGCADIHRMVIVEFPTYEDALRWHASSEYSAAKRQRQSCSTGDLILLDGTKG